MTAAQLAAIAAGVLALIVAGVVALIDRHDRKVCRFANDTDVPDVTSCGATAAWCVCRKPAGHVEAGDRFHRCGDGCTGVWAGDFDGPDFTPITMPSRREDHWHVGHRSREAWRDKRR